MWKHAYQETFGFDGGHPGPCELVGAPELAKCIGNELQGRATRDNRAQSSGLEAGGCQLKTRGQIRHDLPR
jgi:hypothetical protein